MAPLSTLENNCMQITASAAGYSTGATVASACAALLLVKGVHIPWYHLVPFAFFTAMLGVFIAIPMKRQTINHEELPSPAALRLRRRFGAFARRAHRNHVHGHQPLLQNRALKVQQSKRTRSGSSPK